MRESYAVTPTHISLILRGAIATYEAERETILQKLEDNGLGKQRLALETIGEALYWVNGKVDDSLLRDFSDAASHLHTRGLA